jgi:hypothetical protein
MVWERTCTMMERPRFHPTTEVVGFPARIVIAEVEILPTDGLAAGDASEGT